MELTTAATLYLLVKNSVGTYGDKFSSAQLFTNKANAIHHAETKRPLLSTHAATVTLYEAREGFVLHTDESQHQHPGEYCRDAYTVLFHAEYPHSPAIQEGTWTQDDYTGTLAGAFGWVSCVRCHNLHGNRDTSCPRCADAARIRAEEADALSFLTV